MSSSTTRKRRFRALAFALGAILLSLVCCGLYEYSPVGYLFYYLAAPIFEERAEALVPKYDKLNDELWQSLPVYPQATLVPESQKQRGPGYGPVPPGGPAWPRSLEACFSTDDSMEQVAGFYHDALERDDWKVFEEFISDDDEFMRRGYTKDQACIRLHYVCWSDIKSKGGETVYRVTVYYDLNVLLGIFHIPKIIYWGEGVGHCP